MATSRSAGSGNVKHHDMNHNFTSS